MSNVAQDMLEFRCCRLVSEGFLTSKVVVAHASVSDGFYTLPILQCDLIETVEGSSTVNVVLRVVIYILEPNIRPLPIEKVSGPRGGLSLFLAVPDNLCIYLPA
jgi:hypothetical protein